MAIDFKSLLKKPMDQIERPKPLPAGSYHGVVSKYEFGESKEKKTPFCRVIVQLTGAGDDIDPSDLEGIDMAKKSLRKDFYITDDALFRFKEFIESLGIPTQGRELDECVPEMLNAAVICAVTQRNSQDGQEIFNDLDRVVGAQ